MQYLENFWGEYSHKNVFVSLLITDLMNNFINLEETTLNWLKKPVLFLEMSEKYLRILHIYGEIIKDFSVCTI